MFRTKADRDGEGHGDGAAAGGAGDFPRTLKIITVWSLLAIALFAGFSEYERRSTLPAISFVGGAASLTLPRGTDGHYRLRATVEGQPLVFLIDTGASMTSIPAEIATRLTLPVHSSARFDTANGPLQANVVIANVRLADAVDFQRLRVAALPNLNGQGLLGMDVLSKFRITQDGGVMELRGP